MTSVSVYLDTVPPIEAGDLGVTLRLDDVTTLHIGGDVPALLRQIAVELFVCADLIDGERTRLRQMLATTAEQVAEQRRKHGEIAPDGTCWKCKVDDHSGHKDYNEGRCYGCSCPVEGDA